MAKSTTKSFTIELALFTNENHYNVLNKRFRIAETIYNALVKYAVKQLKRMKENKTYKKTLRSYLEYKNTDLKGKTKKECKKINEKIKLYSQLLQTIRDSYNLNEYALQGYMKNLQHTYSKHIDSNTYQKIVSTVWRAVDSVLFKNGKKVHFKKFGQLTSLEGKKNTQGIMFKFPENIEIKYPKNLYKKTKSAFEARQKLHKNKQKPKYRIEWNNLIIPVKMRQNDLFVQEALSSSPIKYCRIVRKPFKTGYKYFVQLIMGGLPPAKRINSTGAFRHGVSPNEKVGLDIGTSSLAVCSQDELILTELAKNSTKYDKELNRLYRKLERSKRAMNPHNFNSDGTIKRGIKLTWVRSNNYIKTLFKLKNLYRLKANYIELEHNKLANKVLSLGNDIYVESMNFSALQKRSKETTINKKGKFNRKGRFGKSLNHKAPAKLLTIIDRKLSYIDKSLNEINTTIFKASQYNHIEDTYIKKKLNQRWNKIEGELVQRDLYSAFLIMNSKSNLKETDRALCLKTYESFKEKHDKLIEDLKTNQEEKYLSSFGIKKTA